MSKTLSNLKNCSSITIFKENTLYLMLMPNLIVPLQINAEQYLTYYQGKVKNVSARATDGCQVLFPANILKPFITNQGISGVFKLNFDTNGKLISINKL
jgi:hypothetical protein